MTFQTFQGGEKIVTELSFPTYAYLYVVNDPLPLALLEDLHSIITQVAVELLIFTLKVYVQTYLNFIYLCAILFPDLNPFIKFVFFVFV